jgi:NADP-dependent 3-hydroxy acid dehydrogenase YdfG
MNDMQFTGKHILITGAGSGIGAAIAREFVAKGGNVTLAGRRHEPLAALAAELDQAAGRKTSHVAGGFDVTDTYAIRDGLQTAQACFGAVSILVNNAGEAPSAPF